MVGDISRAADLDLTAAMQQSSVAWHALCVCAAVPAAARPTVCPSKDQDSYLYIWYV